jgi:septum formation protein
MVKIRSLRWIVHIDPMIDMNRTNRKTLILASKSPRRLELLSTLVPADQIVVVESNVDEKIDPRETAEGYCCRIAEKKADVAWRKYAGNRSEIAAVIGADTVVLIAGQIVGQPCGEDDAIRILRKLGGRCHEVITGVALLDPGSGTIDTFSVKSKVWMREIELETIREYVATGEPLDKAGAYAIQGEGQRLVERYEGSYSNIVGLPVRELQAVLSRIFR